jgi:hypothetical protein
MMSAYLAPLANHLWQSTLFVIGVGLIALMLRKNCAAVRHRLWLAASIKFLLPFSLLTALGSHIQWRTPAAVLEAPITIAIEEAGQPPLSLPRRSRLRYRRSRLQTRSRFPLFSYLYG